MKWLWIFYCSRERAACIPRRREKLKNSIVNFMVRVSMSLQHSMCTSLKETHVDIDQSLSTWRFVITSTPCCVSLENLYSTCLGAAAAVLSHKGSTESTGGPEGSVSGSGHLHWDPGLSAQPSSRHAPGRNEPRRISTGWSAGTNTHLHTHTHIMCSFSGWYYTFWPSVMSHIKILDERLLRLFSVCVQVVTANHACLLVPLQLEASLWRLVPGEETLLTHPLHWMVRRINLEYFPRGLSYWDRWSHTRLKQYLSFIR